MSTLAPLTVAVPLLAATILVAATSVLRRPAVDVVAGLVALAVTVMCAVLVVGSASSPTITWLGGWRPEGGVALGISMVVDPLGAGLATLAGALTTASFVFGVRYFDTEEPLFHTLGLVFLAGMVGFCLSGDLFNMFVFFELMSVAAYALVGFETEETAPLSGALNFAVTNSVGASLILAGIGLVYGRTGALNLAQLGRALEHAPADGLVICAFVLIVTGFLVKAAVVPFHFWLADAYAVAPVPLCIILAGATSELGLYAVVRVYWTVFSGPLGPHAVAVSGVLVTAGALTAVLGGIMAFTQRHLKRMLAFVTVSHIGSFLVAAALLTPDGLAGAGVYLAADGLVKASLFLCAGILQHRRATVDEPHLRGQGRGLPAVGALWGLGALAVASLPPFGPFLGKEVIERALDESGAPGLATVLVLSSVFTGGALLRAGGRIWFGLGPAGRTVPGGAVGDEEVPSTASARHRTPASMLVPAVVLLALGLGVGFAPGFAEAARSAAAGFTDRPAYAAAVLDGVATPTRAVASEPSAEASSYVNAALSLGGAGVLAAGALLLPGRVRRQRGGPVLRWAGGAVAGLRRLHSGHVGDYVAWLVVGTAAFGAALTLAVG